MRIIKSKSTCWLEHAAQIENTINVHKTYSEKSQEKKPGSEGRLLLQDVGGDERGWIKIVQIWPQGTAWRNDLDSDSSGLHSNGSD